MSVTIKDIAKIAEVSHTTVSRALRQHPALPQSTITRIRKIADELGYVPSAAAQSLKTNRSRLVGVMVHRIADPFFAEVLDGIQDVLQREDYNLFLVSPGKNLEYEAAAIEALIKQRIEGIIICSTSINETDLNRLEEAGIPSVVAHNPTLDTRDFAIYHDDFYGGTVMVNHLIELGHEDIAFIGHAQGGRVSQERQNGYETALLQAGIPVREAYIVQAENDDFEGGFHAALQLMDYKPTAIFCYNDLIAIGALQALQQANLHVPNDCSVAGFDNIALSGFVRPAITTFDQPKYQLGVEAATMLLSRLDTVDQTEEILLLRGNIVIRDSTAAAMYR